MIFESITTLIMGGITLKAYLSKNSTSNDSQKIQKIFSLSGLNVKDGTQTLTPRLLKRKNMSWGTEYRYRLPLGRSFEDFKAKHATLEDGLNNKRVRITVRDLTRLQMNRNIIKSIKTLWTRKLSQRKELELSFDGVLILRVYNEPLPKEVAWQAGVEWSFLIGVARQKNEEILHDFEKAPHLVIGGATKYGKSNLLNGLICSLLTSKPDHTKLYLIDLKGGVELCDYERATQTVSIAYEPEEALITLEKAYKAMKHTQQRLKMMGKKKVQEAGIKERHFIIIDEVGELNPEEATDKKDIYKDGVCVYKSEKTIKMECQTIMSKIARLGASLGFYQVLATQYPTGDVIPRTCKQNSDTKLCFRVQNGTASRVVLDEIGAEDLPVIKGRAILQMADKRIVVQTPLINSTDISQVIAPYLKKEEIQIECKPERRTDNVVIEEV